MNSIPAFEKNEDTTVPDSSTRSPKDNSDEGERNVNSLSHERADKDGFSLQRGLQARHVAMIAIGGALGNGLLIGTGEALAESGPGSILISYTFVGLLVYIVMSALGEMATWLPLPSGFAGYAARYCDPALGFALGYVYWFKYIITTPNQLTAAALVLQYWVPRETLNPGVFIAIFMVVIIFINAFGGVRFFGEVEFWMSSVKVIIITGVILLSLILACGGGPSGQATGFIYYHNPGAFKPYLTDGAVGKFSGFWKSLVQAVYAYLGTELVGVTVGEAQNPRRNIPKAIKLTFYRILFFYILSVFFLGMLVPYDSHRLVFATTSAKTDTAAASPFVVAVEIAGVNVLPDVLNACILIFVFSASNSDLYIATRTIYGLAREGKAPKILARTDKRGVPFVALALSSCFLLLAFLNVSDDSATVFGYFVNLVTIFGLLTWISILVTHIFFIRARKAQGILDDMIVFKAPLGIWASYLALYFCCIIALTANFYVFVGGFDYQDFITGYLGIPLYLIFIIGYKLIMRSTRVKAETADLYSGKAEIDRDEEDFVAMKRLEEDKRKETGRIAVDRWYRFVSWLF